MYRSWVKLKKNGVNSQFLILFCLVRAVAKQRQPRIHLATKWDPETCGNSTQKIAPALRYEKKQMTKKTPFFLTGLGLISIQKFCTKFDTKGPASYYFKA